MVNRTRDIVRQFHGYCDDARLSAEATRWTIAYVYACKQHLRWKSACPNLRQAGVLSRADMDRLEAADHLPNFCMDMLTQCIKRAREANTLDGFEFRALDENVQSFEDQIGKCERILKTPVPFSFVLHLRSIIMLNIVALPLYLIGLKKYEFGAIPITLIYSYVLTGLEDLGQMIENPFRENFHALPLDGLCNAIRRNLLNIERRAKLSASSDL